MPAVPPVDKTHRVAVVGGGPAGLMAAETLAAAGLRVDVFDAMPSVGRKFLMAGKGGMNLTHSEPLPAFLARYGSRRDAIAPLVDLMNPDALRAWVHGLGVDTFVGSSGRVFPTDMKAAPMLRAWLHRLRESGVQFHMRHRWIGWDTGDTGDTGEGEDSGRSDRQDDGHLACGKPASNAISSEKFAAKPGNGPDDDTSRVSCHPLRFATPTGESIFHADAVVFALGGGSWPRLGSDATWIPLLAEHGVEIAPLQPANCGFDADWSEHFRSRHAGEFLKSVAMAVTVAPDNSPPPSGPSHAATFRQGEFVVTESGIEGSLVYALSSGIREQINHNGYATVLLDLAPGLSHERVSAEVTHPRGSRSMSSHLRSRLSISGVKAALLHECLPKETFLVPEQLAAAIKSLPLRLVRARPIAEAISSAGGVAFESLDARLMIAKLPGAFCAGEMLDWEAPTGGYLLTACFASGLAAGQGIIAYLRSGQR
jgi:uncharacterized flavoprotein (TIGR03862 family)